MSEIEIRNSKKGEVGGCELFCKGAGLAVCGNRVALQGSLLLLLNSNLTDNVGNK